MIELQHVTCSFAGAPVLSDISFSVGEGEVVGLLGPNGAGKTTCLRLIPGLLQPDEGQVRVSGMDVARRGAEARRLLGYVAEGAPVHGDLRVVEHLRFWGKLRGLRGASLAAEVERVSQLCGLADVARRICGQLSRGYRQRLALAAALAGDPPVLVLDEPTVGMDPNQLAVMRRLLLDLAPRHAILISSHILSEVRACCSRVLILRQGVLAAEGSPDQLPGGPRDQALVVEVRGPPEEVRLALSGLPGVTRVDPLGGGGGPDRGRFRLQGGEGEALKSELAALLQRRGWVLLELRGETSELEQAFARVTR